MPNALASETSPYLRQHAENPVDWLPWGPVALNRARGRPVKLEASGSVSLESVRAIAETGVDYISVGAFTHSARSVDVALEMEP